MNNNRNTAIMVGVLYVVGTVAGILSRVCTQSIFTAPDILSAVAAQPLQLVVGVLFVLTMGLALARVPVMLYPILKKDHRVLALGYVVFRGALETSLYLNTATIWIFLLVLAQENTAGAGSASSLQMLGSILVKGNDAISSLLVIVFSLDALMLYTMFYQSRLVPGRISGFGIVVISLMMTACVLSLFCGNRITRYIPLAAPIAMQEIVLAVWLIVKRFSTPVMTSTSRKTETSELLSAV